MKKVSVLIPTYRPGDYIYNCLKSISEQQLSRDLFTVYVAINGSELAYKDKLSHMLNRFDFNFKLFFLEEPGVSNARNFLIDVSAEEYIVFIDDDDCISPDFLSELLRICSHDVMAVSNISTFVQSVDRVYSHPRNSIYEQLEASETKHWKARKYFSFPWAKMVHRSAIGEVRQDRRLKLGEDSLFFAEVSKNIKMVRKTRPETCYFVNERVGSSSRKPVDKRLEFFRIIYLSKIYFKMLFNNDFQRLFILSRLIATLLKLRNIIAPYSR